MAGPKNILLVFSDEGAVKLLQNSILAPKGYQVTVAPDCKTAENYVRRLKPDLMMLGDSLPDGDHIELATRLLEKQPTLPIILFTANTSALSPEEIIRLGLVDWITPPLKPDDVLKSIQRGLERSQHWKDWFEAESHRYTGALMQRVDELETLTNISQSITAQLDLEKVLETVVDVAVKMTKAEEGSIMLVDEDTGDLYVRASRNLNDEEVKTLRLPVEDSLAGEVVRTGQPYFTDEAAPQKIKTAYLVQAVIYVPLKIKSRVIGVLTVDNRESSQAFEQGHITLMTALADYAAIALENARLYGATEIERGKLEKILTQVQDGVLVVDMEDNIALVNPIAQTILGLRHADVKGKPYADIITDKALLTALLGQADNPDRIEIEVGDAKIYKITVTEIPEVGMVATFHDISYLKELDRLKTDFLNSISHDLRSPLTSILGYVELIGRVGEINEQQQQFIDRVAQSVRNITDMVGDLLNMGKIEVGIVEEVENVPVGNVLLEAIDSLRGQANERNQKLDVAVAKTLPHITGNRIQLLQVFDNLVGNAIKYSPVGGLIAIHAVQENGQVIVKVADNGPGIPPEDHVKVFDKFYRSKNVIKKFPGTGLGLAITKSIVENHNGRVWVDSTVGEGSTFVVVLPVAGEPITTPRLEKQPG